MSKNPIEKALWTLTAVMIIPVGVIMGLLLKGEHRSVSEIEELSPGVQQHLLVLAMIEKESSNGTRLYNPAEGAYGVLQIRRAALLDVNEYAGTNYTLYDMYRSRALSVWAFYQYCERYDAETPEGMARLWAGGPSGQYSNAAERYWLDVRERMERIREITQH